MEHEKLEKLLRKAHPSEITLETKIKNLPRLFDMSLANADKKLIITLVVLVSFGLVMGISTASYTVINNGLAITGFMLRQILFVALGLGAMALVSAIDYHRLSLGLLTYALPVVLVLNILPKFMGVITNGASRWLQFGPMSIQPSELAKYFVVAFAACLLALPNKNSDEDFKRYCLVLFVGAAFTGTVLLLQSNLSTAAIIFFITIILIAVSGLKLAAWLFPFVTGLIVGGAAIFGVDYRRARVLGFLNPFRDPSGDTMQLVQSLYALSTGGLFGRGLGNSRLKAYWLPYAENDFIFAIICEELGLIGALAVMGGLAFLVIRGLKIAREAPDKYGSLLATGIISVIALQSLINMAVVMGAFPVTGVPLPFISAGGTSLTVNLAAMGILINISKQSGSNGSES